MNYVNSTSLDIALKVSSSEGRRVAMLSIVGKRPNFSLRLYLRTRGESLLAKFVGHFETPTANTDILTFLENKRLFPRTTYIRLLIYLKPIYGQKMKEIDFSTLATRWSMFLDRRS